MFVIAQRSQLSLNLYRDTMKITLEQQLQQIIDDAVNYGVSPVVVELAIAPVIKAYAQQLKKLEYYVLQNLEGDWVLTTINNPKLQQSKQVIYAFVSVKDAALRGKSNPELAAAPISVVQLLFRLSSLQMVDSMIFLEDSQNLNRGVEIERDRLFQQIRQQIQQLQTPPNLA